MDKKSLQKTNCLKYPNSRKLCFYRKHNQLFLVRNGKPEEKGNCWQLPEVSWWSVWCSTIIPSSQVGLLLRQVMLCIYPSCTSSVLFVWCPCSVKKSKSLPVAAAWWLPCWHLELTLTKPWGSADSCPFTALRTLWRMTPSLRGHVSSYRAGCCGLCDTKALRTVLRWCSALSKARRVPQSCSVYNQLSSHAHSRSQNAPCIGKDFY